MVGRTCHALNNVEMEKQKGFIQRMVAQLAEEFRRELGGKLRRHIGTR